MVIHTELVVSVVRERFGQDCHCSQSLGEVLHKGTALFSQRRR